MMIERNNILPCRVTKHFVTASEFQEKINILVYQGESYHPEQNLKIGELCFPVPKAPAGKEGVFITFTYNINGILEVFAESDSTENGHTSVTIISLNSSLRSLIPV